MKKQPIIGVITNSEFNFNKYVNDFGNKENKYIHIDNDAEKLDGLEFHRLIKTYGHEDVSKIIIQKAQQRIRNPKK